MEKRRKEFNSVFAEFDSGSTLDPEMELERKKEDEEKQKRQAEIEDLIFAVTKPFVCLLFVGIYGSGDKGPEALNELENKFLEFHNTLYDFSPIMMAKNKNLLREHIAFTIAEMLGPKSVGMKEINEKRRKEILMEMREKVEHGKLKQELLERDDKIKRLKRMLRAREVETFTHTLVPRADPKFCEKVCEQNAA